VNQVAQYGLNLGPVAQERRAALEDVEDLILVLVPMERGCESRGVHEVDHREPAARALAAHLDGQEVSEEPQGLAFAIAQVLRPEGQCHCGFLSANIGDVYIR
jgi:hypothetical protein